MPIDYLKKAAKTPETESGNARAVVDKMLAEIEARGEEAVREYCKSLDHWTGEIIVTPEAFERRTRDIPEGTKRDIEFATERVRRFGEAQVEVRRIDEQDDSRTAAREFALEQHHFLLPRHRHQVDVA